jgi:hypothetical protein
MICSSRAPCACLLFSLLACGGATPSVVSAPPPAKSTTAATTPTATTDDEPPAGPITRATVEVLPKWVAARSKDETKPDDAAARALNDVPKGATVRVFLGAWCGDSRREVTRLWRALDLAGGAVPFTIEYIAVDRAKTAPGGLTDGIGLRYVPTFVVMRDGKEIGRIIESAPAGIEKDLRSLLTGERKGIISARTDVGA